jgi:hypothetical protein
VLGGLAFVLRHLDLYPFSERQLAVMPLDQAFTKQEEISAANHDGDVPKHASEHDSFTLPRECPNIVHLTVRC